MVKGAFHPLSVPLSRRASASDGVQIWSKLIFGWEADRTLDVRAILMAPFVSTVTSLAPASLAARIARAMSACVTLAGRRGIDHLHAICERRRTTVVQATNRRRRSRARNAEMPHWNSARSLGGERLAGNARETDSRCEFDDRLHQAPLRQLRFRRHPNAALLAFCRRFDGAVVQPGTVPLSQLVHRSSVKFTSSLTVAQNTTILRGKGDQECPAFAPVREQLDDPQIEPRGIIVVMGCLDRLGLQMSSGCPGHMARR